MFVEMATLFWFFDFPCSDGIGRKGLCITPEDGLGDGVSVVYA